MPDFDLAMNDFTHKGLHVIPCSVRRHDGYVPEARILDHTSGKELARVQDYATTYETQARADQAAQKLAVAWIDRYVGAARS
jgi:hypothetical protein